MNLYQGICSDCDGPVHFEEGKVYDEPGWHHDRIADIMTCPGTVRGDVPLRVTVDTTAFTQAWAAHTQAACDIIAGA